MSKEILIQVGRGKSEGKFVLTEIEIKVVNPFYYVVTQSSIIVNLLRQRLYLLVAHARVEFPIFSTRAYYLDKEKPVLIQVINCIFVGKCKQNPFNSFCVRSTKRLPILNLNLTIFCFYDSSYIMEAKEITTKLILLLFIT